MKKNKSGGGGTVKKELLGDSHAAKMDLLGGDPNSAKMRGLGNLVLKKKKKSLGGGYNNKLGGGRTCIAKLGLLGDPTVQKWVFLGGKK